MRRARTTASKDVMTVAQGLTEGIRHEALEAPPSGILEVFRRGHGRPGLIPMWTGESDLPTPPFICAAATRSLAAGETFYTNNAGVPELRTALARYHDRVYGGVFGAPFDPARFVVTGSGMHAIQLAVTLVAGAGDEVIVSTPAWPNFPAAVGLRGARPVALPMSERDGRWTLDPDRVAAAIGPATRAIFVNSPSNPTGWTADSGTLSALLAIARRHGLWIVADEVYGRFHHVEGEPVAPSFHALIEPDDRLIFVNTFSKNWAMTGWRIGWMEIPPALTETVLNLVQYSSSGVATFMQRAATVALDEGEGFLAHQLARTRRGLRVLEATLGRHPRIRFAPPPGAFYLFFGIDGVRDTRALCLRLVDEANLGLAPGTAFGEAGEGYVRMCFARSEEDLREAALRLTSWLDASGPVV
jgi:aspartate/methionine/tyrosine aminotransferase